MRSLLVGGLALLACPLSAIAPAQVVGGWSKVPVTDEGVVAAANFAVAARRAVDDEAGDGKLVLVEIVDAEQQVVAGLNYRLTLQVKAGDAVKTVEAMIWARVWLDEDERYELTAWRTIEEPVRQRLRGPGRLQPGEPLPVARPSLPSGRRLPA